MAIGPKRIKEIIVEKKIEKFFFWAFVSCVVGSACNHEWNAAFGWATASICQFQLSYGKKQSA